VTAPVAGAPPPLLDIRDVAKRYGRVAALAGVSLEIGQGEFVALLGPSGCGKTTLLRCIAGFVAPDSGMIAIDGIDVTALPPHRRPLNTVFQNYALFPHMTVAENVGYGPARRGVPRAEIAREVDAALAMVGLDGFAPRRPNQLSGGQQQRVALARALINRPRLLLLDEPLGALDLKLRKQMQLELKRLQARLGITFVFVTHDQEEAMTMADRIVVMEGGSIARARASSPVSSVRPICSTSSPIQTAGCAPGSAAPRSWRRSRAPGPASASRASACSAPRLCAPPLPMLPMPSRRPSPTSSTRAARCSSISTPPAPR
jgi:ABC-type Fe3+/spermidine/putrescine transport system ATPase subunit